MMQAVANGTKKKVLFLQPLTASSNCSLLSRAYSAVQLLRVAAGRGGAEGVEGAEVVVKR